MSARQKSGCGCATVFLTLVIAAAVVFIVAWQLGYVERYLYKANVEAALEQETAQVELSDMAWDGGYVYSTLDADDQSKYRILYEALVTREPRTYPETDMDDLARMRDCVLADHPELFYVVGVRQVTTTNSASGMVTDLSVEGQYSYGPEESEMLKSQVDAAVEACLAELPADADDYGKAKFAYEYLARNTTYNHEVAESVRLSNDNLAEADASPGQTIVDVFVNGNAVCGGYASAYQYLMQRLGIECAYVTGMVNGGRHAWCLVCLDGEYYYVDPTWGDPQFTGEEGVASEQSGAINYDYLCITTDDVQLTHTIDDLYEVPACTSTDDNYYVREGLLFDWADEARLGQLSSDALWNGTFVQIRCTNGDAYWGLLDNSVSTGNLATYLPGDSYRYTHSDDFMSISIYPE